MIRANQVTVVFALFSYLSKYVLRQNDDFK